MTKRNALGSLTLILWMVGCGGPSDGETQPATGSPDDDPTGNPGGTPGGSPGGTPGGSASSPDWSGTWEVRIDWHVSCESFGQYHDNSGSDGWSLPLNGPPDDLVVPVNGNDWYTVRGSADDSGITLCGKFPMYDHNDEVASSDNDNSICLRGTDVVSEVEVRGTAEGRFTGQFGADCELLPSDAVFTH